LHYYDGDLTNLRKLGKPQLRQRRERIPSADVWNDAQLEHRDRREFEMMIFGLVRGAWWTEVPRAKGKYPKTPRSSQGKHRIVERCA
jgi:hypothetical protein